MNLIEAKYNDEIDRLIDIQRILLKNKFIIINSYNCINSLSFLSL